MIDPTLLGQILLTFTTGVISLVTSIVGLFAWRSRTNLKIALKEAEARVKEAEAKAQERVIAAEKDLREAVDTNVLIARLIEHLSETSKRASEDDARNREALVHVLDASRKSSDILQSLVLDVNSVKTNLGEHSIVLEAVRQIVAGLPTQLDDKTNPLLEVVALLVKRVETLLDSLDEAKKQLVVELVAAIREVLLQAQSQQITPPSLPISITPIEGI